MLYETLQKFSHAVKNELENNLIPFWLERSVDYEYGGFIGRMSNDGRIDTKDAKGLILNARILWTFSALYRFNENDRYLEMARRAYDYLQTYFWDNRYGGVFWQVDFEGRPLDDKKKIYGQAFYIYALAEYVKAFGEEPAIKLAKQLYTLIESNSRDKIYGGYIEVCNRDWSAAEDLRLSEKDMDEKKSMNNHLHLLEAYTNLYRIWPDTRLRQCLTELFDIFDLRITDQVSGHLNHFFDETWRPKSTSYTFGHDIEASWLLYEAAEVLNDSNITSRARRSALRLAQIALAEALDENGALCYEGRAGKITDTNREWWPQGESVVGFLNAYKLSADRSFLEAAQRAWLFIEKYFVDKKNGEWFWRLDRNGRPDSAEPKVSQWKGPYHNVRTCLETIKRLAKIKLMDSK